MECYWQRQMNYTEKINSLMAQSHQIQECANGLCTHPEHKINALVWVIPGIIAAVLIGKLIKTGSAKN